MAKQLNMSINITANTEQAKREMKSLQDQLGRLGKGMDIGSGVGSSFTKGIETATKDLAQLQLLLRQTVNVDTGKLDFAKFNDGLKRSGKTLEDYSKTLISLGPEGQQAFLKLSNAVAQSEVPVMRVSNLFKQLGTTLANTARWQISSSVLHGFMGAVQSAYGYAQDLNRSLNDIRIVTGYSANEMAKFAETANKAAQTLSTTTTAYTDAALIFYQQGLSDEQVKARTDATIKMANVTGENAEHVSSYMTAIWNNFDDGSKNLEYYADVMTKLGAATAASSEEIAEGMEKFAAVGNTVGLSYEYAAAAVTTVIDKTRQSADIVGTSFKTIFARLEGLQLGETLDDGTNLNKYSKALASVGINIKDQNGELKQMDQILDEMGAKWETLSKDQQVALAQTVGGVRQYTQLIALMENFDAFRENIRLGLNSEGTLQEQQNIYAQSWEASSKRVRAAWEALYQDLLNDDWFIGLNNELAKFLKQLDRLIDRMGGLRGLLIQIAPILTNIFNEQITKGVGNLRLNILTLTGSGRKRLEDERAKEIERATKGVKSVFGENSIEAAQQESRLNANTELAKITHKLTEDQKQLAKFAQDTSDAEWEQVRAQEAKVAKMKEELEIAEKRRLNSSTKNDFIGVVQNNEYLEDTSKANIISAIEGSAGYQGLAQLGINPKGANVAQLTGNLQLLAQYASNYDLTLSTEYTKTFDELQRALQSSNGEVTEKIKEKAKAFYDELQAQATSTFDNLMKVIDVEVKKSYKETEESVKRDVQEEIKQIYKKEGFKGNTGRQTNRERVQEAWNALDSRSDLTGEEKKLKEIQHKILLAYEAQDKSLANLRKSQDDLTESLQVEAGDYSVQEENLKSETEKAAAMRDNASKVLPGLMRQMAEDDAKRMPNLEERFTAYTQAATSFLAVLDSITNVFDVWNSEASLGEKLKTTLQAIIMMSTQQLTLKKSDSIVTLKKILFTTADSKAMEDNTKATLKNATAKTKDAEATTTNTAAQAAETGAKNADTAASAGLLSRPLSGAGIGLGIAVGVIATYVAAEKAWEESYIKVMNERQAAADARVEEAKAWKEEHTQQLEAVENYKKVAEELDKATESRDKYNETLLETAKALGVENAEVLAATKQYDLLQDAVDRAADSLEGEEQNKNLDIINSTAESLYYGGAAVAGNPSNLLTGGIGALLAGAENYIGHGILKDAGESQLLRDLRELEISGVSTQGGAISYDTSEMSSEDISKLMHFFADVQANPGKYGGDSNELIKGINKINDNFAEAVAQFDASVQEFRKSEIDYAFEGAAAHEGNQVSAALSGASGFTTSNGTYFDFSSMADIESIRNSMIKAFAEMWGTSLDDPTIVEAVDQNLAKLFGEAFQTERVLDSFAQLNSLDSTELKQIYDEQNESTQEAIRQAIGKNATLTAGLIRAAGGNIEEVIDDIEVIANSIDISEFENSFRTIQATLNSLKFGDVLDPEKIAELATNLGFDSVEELMENYGSYFTELSDGVYQMTGRVEDLSQEMNTSLLKRLEDREETQQYLDSTEEQIKTLGEQQEQRRSSFSLTNYDNDIVQAVDDQFEGGFIGHSDTEIMNATLQALKDSEDSDEQAEQIEELTKLIDEINAVDTEISELSEEQQRYLDYQNGEKTAFEDVLVTEYTTLEELQDLYEEGWITAEKYYKSLRAAAIQEAKALGLNIEELEDYAHYLEVNNEALQGDATAAMDVALAHMRLQEGLKDLNSNFSKYNEVLHSTETDSIEYASAMTSIEKDLQHLFNTDEAIDAKFITDNLELIEQAAQGDIEAITDLQLAFALASTDAEGAFAKAGQDLTEFQNKVDELEWDGIEIGASIDTIPMLNDWFDAMQQMVIEGKMSADDMQSIWNSLGFELKPQFDKSVWVNRFSGITAEEPGEPKSDWKQHYIFTGYYNGTNKAAAGVSRSSSGSSGGGGGKSSQKEQKEEEERYYVISRLLKDQEDLLNRLDKAKSRAHGKGHIDLINQEAEALERDIQLQEQYLNEIQGYLSSDRAKVAGLGAQFDENGIITNYEQLLKQYVNEYNAAVAAGDETATAQAEKRFEDFKNYAAKYDETLQLYESEWDKLVDKHNADYDKMLERTEYKLEIELEIDDSELDLLEYRLKRLQDMPFTTAQQMANRTATLKGTMDRGSETETAINEILGTQGLSLDTISGMSMEEIASKGFTDEQISKLRELIPKWQEYGNTVADLAKEIISGPLEAFKEWNAEFEHQNQIIQHNAKLVQSYTNISKLVYSNIPGMNDDFISSLLNNSYDIAVSNVEALKDEYDAATKAYNDYYEAVKDKLNDPVLGKQIKENLRELETAMNQAEENMLAGLESALQAAQALLDDSLEKAKRSFQEATATDDWSMTLFEHQKEMDDMYLDDYEKIYEFSKLTRDVNNSIDNAPQLRDKERLREVTEEILQLERSGAQVSQYQVDALRAKYELRLAEIALEDAQDAKNTVRMQRDNEGNWSYVYTAEQGKIDEARQNQEDKLYEYQKLNTNFIKDQQTNFLNMEKKYQEEVEKIAKDALLSDDEKRERIRQTTEYYEQLGYNMNEQLMIAIGKNKDLYNDDWKWFNQNLGYKISAEKDYITTFENTYLGPLGNLYKTFTEAMTGSDGYVTKVNAALEQFKVDQEQALKAAGLKNFIDDVGSAASGAATAAEGAAGKVHTAAGNMATDISKVIDEVKKLNEISYQPFIDRIGGATGALTEFLNTWTRVNTVSVSSPPANGGDSGVTPQTGDTTVASSAGNAASAAASFGSQLIEALDPSKLDGVHSLYKYFQDRKKAGHKLLEEEVAYMREIEAARDSNARMDIYNKYVSTHSALMSRLKWEGYKINTFDTGGYTGAWGTDGRLALLHQKELVLNPQDTENMLKMTEYVRDLAQMVDLRAAAATMASISDVSRIGSSAQTIDQNVHIEASFPNVTSSSEIEEAFNNLVNRAAQYASRSI